MIRRFTLTLMLLAVAASAFALSDKLSTATKRFVADYKARVPAQRALMKPVVKQQGTEDLVSAFVTLGSLSDTTLVKPLGVVVQESFGSMITALVPANAIEHLAELDCVRAVSVAQEMTLSTNTMRDAANVTPVHSGQNMPWPYHGKGVVVGIVDAGFDFNHMAFKDGSGNTRIKYLYLAYQGLIFKGKEYTSASEIAELTTDTENSTHGQHVAGIACGTKVGEYGGMADSADIAIGAMGEKALNTYILNSAKKIAQYAKGEGKPCVINISYGSDSGPHNGTSEMSAGLDALVEDGVIICVAAGNNGARNMSLHKYFYSSSPSVATMLSSSQANYASEVEAWARSSTEFTAQVFIYDTTTGSEVYSSKEYDGDKTLPASGVLGIGKDDGLSDYGDGTVKLDFSTTNDRFNVLVTVDYTPTAARYKLGLRFTGTAGEQIDAWCTDSHTTFTSNGVSGYVNGDASKSISDMATGEKTITVGAWLDKKQWKALNGTTLHYTTGTAEGDICDFSGWGYDTRTTPMAHPDICAPGQAVVASLNNNYYTGTAANYIVAQASGSDGKTYQWGVMQGTSMATPCVAGIIALWMEARPSLGYSRVREIFSQTAIKDEFTGSYPAVKWGKGKINAWLGFDDLLTVYYVNDGNVWYRLHRDQTATVKGLSKIDARSISIRDFKVLSNGAAYKVKDFETGAMSRFYSSYTNISAGNYADFDYSLIDTVTYNASECDVKYADFYNKVKPTVFVAGNLVGTNFTVPQYLMYGNNALKSVRLGVNATGIASHAFYNCTTLDTIAMSNVKEIGPYAFAYCTSLASTTLPAVLDTIGTAAFSHCTGLQRLTCKATTPPALGNNVWSAVDQAAVTLNVPQASVTLYKAAEQWKEFFIPGGKVLGDVNLDGQVTVADVTEVYSIILGNPSAYLSTADVNNDGQVTVADVTIIYNLILGIE